MKNIAVLILGLFLACNSSQKTTSDTSASSAQKNISPVDYAESITEAELKEHLYIYASDEFEGRETGQPGQKKAVEYLREQYKALGIPAAKKDGDYFQDVPLEISKLPSGTITVNGKEYAIGEHVLTFSPAEGKYDGLVYGGYGIEEDQYSDYENIDVSGKIVMVKAGEPKNSDGNFVLSGSSEKSVWSNMSESIGKRMELASEKGAKGIIFYDVANFSRFKDRYNAMKRNDKGRMMLKATKNEEFSSFFVDADFAKAVLPNIEKDTKPKHIKVSLNLNVASANQAVKSENVVALLRGLEKPNEYVIISSHLDHIGIDVDGEINNGADDDGSGSVAMLEIAEAFKKAADDGNGPKRSIVFLHVTGEEKGLLGSQYYTDIEPLFPLKQTVANLNIDMIGRIDPKRDGNRNYIYLIGSDKLSTDLHELSEQVNTKYSQLELDYKYNDPNDPNRFYYRSDHYNFAKNNIPIIFYFNGTHADYHRPGDTPDKINYDLLQDRTRLIFYTAWEIANRDQRIKVDKSAK